MKKVLSFLGNVLIVLIMIVAVVMTVAVITSSLNEKAKIPNLFGYAALSVQTDSMVGENGFNVGDLIIDKMLTEEEANNLKVGDVITFVRTLNDQQYLETHRIVPFETDNTEELDLLASEIVDDIWIRGGVRFYTTKGDHEQYADRTQVNTVEYTSQTNIIGLWTGVHIPKLGAVMDFMQSSTGFMVCIVLPVALFFIYQLYIFIMTLTRRQKEKALAEVSDKEEELKKKAIAEFLAQQQANGGQAASSDTKPAEPDPPGADEDAKKKDELDEEKAESADEAQPDQQDKKNKKKDKKKKKEADTQAAAGEGTDAQAEAETSTEEKAEEKAEDKEEEKPADEAKPDEKNEEEKTEDKKEEKKEEKKQDKKEEKKEEKKEDKKEEKKEDKKEEKKEDKTEEKKEDKPADSADISEEEKNRIIQEYLAKQAQEKKD